METSRRLSVVVAIVAGLTSVSALFVWAITRDASRSGSLKLAVGRQSVEWKIEKNELSFKQLLDFVFAEPPQAPDGQALLVDAIEHLAYEHPVSRKIRELQGTSKGPFAVRLTPVKVLAPAGSPLRQGHAAVCRDHEFFRANLILLNKDHTNAVRVTASEHILCERTGTPAIPVQLNPVDAGQLFGVPPTDGDEDGFAWAYQPEPILPGQS